MPARNPTTIVVFSSALSSLIAFETTDLLVVRRLRADGQFP